MQVQSSLCVCVFICVCVWEREIKREKKKAHVDKLKVSSGHAPSSWLATAEGVAGAGGAGVL